MLPVVSPYLPPPLKWAGGKRWLVPALLPIFATMRHRRLVEPFVGGMSVALALNPERALLGDVIPHLVNFYNWVAEDSSFCVDFPPHSSDVYYAARKEFNDILTHGDWLGRRAAELFYFINQTSFNGICRFNSSGGFNVPYSFRKSKAIVGGFAKYSETISRWDVVWNSFEALSVQDEDFIYADPPYDEGFSTYSQGGFAWKDQARLADWLAGHKGPVLASNHMTERVAELYRERGFFVVQVLAPRRISCTGNRTPKAEVLMGRNISEKLVRAAVAGLPTTFGARNNPADLSFLKVPSIGRPKIGPHKPARRNLQPADAT